MNFIADVQNYAQGYGLISVFLIMFIENMGLPFPTEIGFLIAQSQIQSGAIGYFTAILVITAGQVCGATVGYSIGRFGDRKLSRIFKHNSRLLTTQEKLVKWYQRWGSVTVFATRLIGYVRPWSSLVAGFSRQPFAPFLIWTMLGSLIFSSVSLVFTKYLVLFWRQHPQFRLEIVIVILVLFFGAVTVSLIKSLYDKISGH